MPGLFRAGYFRKLGALECRSIVFQSAKTRKRNWPCLRRGHSSAVRKQPPAAQQPGKPCCIMPRNMCSIRYFNCFVGSRRCISNHHTCATASRHTIDRDHTSDRNPTNSGTAIRIAISAASFVRPMACCPGCPVGLSVLNARWRNHRRRCSRQHFRRGLATSFPCSKWSSCRISL